MVFQHSSKAEGSKNIPHHLEDTDVIKFQLLCTYIEITLSTSVTQLFSYMQESRTTHVLLTLNR